MFICLYITLHIIITATKPGQQLQAKTNKKKDRGFKSTSDGRLIIKDDSSDDDNRKKPINFSSDSDSGKLIL